MMVQNVVTIMEKAPIKIKIFFWWLKASTSYSFHIEGTDMQNRL